MKCPYCAYLREQGGRLTPRRRGQPASAAAGSACPAIQRFTTYETVESLPLMVVIKKDGSAPEL